MKKTFAILLISSALASAQVQQLPFAKSEAVVTNQLPSGVTQILKVTTIQYVELIKSITNAPPKSLLAPAVKTMNTNRPSARQRLLNK